jgi:hypothetical protein
VSDTEEMVELLAEGVGLVTEYSDRLTATLEAVARGLNRIGDEARAVGVGTRRDGLLLAVEIITTELEAAAREANEPERA